LHSKQRKDLQPRCSTCLILPADLQWVHVQAAGAHWQPCRFAQVGKGDPYAVYSQPDAGLSNQVSLASTGACAGQPERATSKHSGRHAKPHKHHASPFRSMPGVLDKPFAASPPSTGPAVNANGVHPGAGASSPPVHAPPVGTTFLGFPPSPGHPMYGVPLSPMPSSGAVPDAAAQLPSRFAAVVNISEGAARSPKYGSVNLEGHRAACNIPHQDPYMYMCDCSCLKLWDYLE
jgi:hypothetical protein